MSVLESMECRLATDQEIVDSLRHLVFGARNCDYITCHLGAWKIDLAVPFFLELVDFMHFPDELSMVQAVDYDGFGDEFRVLHNTHQTCQSGLGDS